MVRILGTLGCVVLLVVAFLLLLIGIPLLVLLGGSAPGNGDLHAVLGADNQVTLDAKLIALHLHDCRTLGSQNAQQNGCQGSFPRYAAYDPGFPSTILQWGNNRCGSCWEWQSGSFQCVSLVTGAYALFHPLDFTGDGNQFAGLYSSSAARAAGYRFIPTGQGLPITPGDIMTWAGGTAGHVSIVLGWRAPSANQPGAITFAQANAWKSVDTLPIHPDLTIATENGYWNGYKVLGYIHPGFLPIVAPALLDGSQIQKLPQSPYLEVARQAARSVGIDDTLFLSQINAESHFDPAAVSSQGAIGIAQLMPATAAHLGVDPHNPTASLSAAARLLATERMTYQGDDLKALAAYNAGDARVQQAQATCRAGWLVCLPAETQFYVQTIVDDALLER